MAAPISTLSSVCSECGTVYVRETSGSRCDQCKPTRERTARRIASESRRGTRRSRGYDAAWDRLSARARREQPFCSDCGREDDLTTDHSPEAWERRARGLPVRLRDVDVVCSRCNAERGPARGPDALERPTMGTAARELDELADTPAITQAVQLREALEDSGFELAETMDDDLAPDDLDERVARGEW